MPFLPTIAQTAAQPLVENHFTWHPIINPYLLFGFLIVSVGLAVVLYLQQRRVAPRGAIIALTVIRALLILLVFGVLLGVGWVFTSTHTERGTLWVVADQSASMGRADPQATDLEKLRWADAAGLLPNGARPGAMDRHAAVLRVLSGDLAFLQSQTRQVGSDEAEAKTRVAAIAKGLIRWQEQVTLAADAIEKDQSAQRPDAAALAKLRPAAADVATRARTVESRSKPDDAAGDVPWTEHMSAIDAAAAACDAAAAASDDVILRKKDPAVVAALDKVGKMTRAELASAFLANKGNRGSDKSKVAGFEALFAVQPMKVMGFGDAPQVLSPADAAQAMTTVRGALAKAAAPVTDLSEGLRAVSEQLSRGEPATVVVVGDFAANRHQGETATAIARLVDRGARVFTVAVGSDQYAPDAAVEKVDAPTWVFKNDPVKVSALLRLDNLPDRKVRATLVRIKTVDGKSEETVVDTQDLTVKRVVNRPGQDPLPQRDMRVVSFAEKKEATPEPGLYDYQVRVDAVPDEAVAANNAGTARVSVKEDKLTVLMIEDQPRHEYKYLHNYFERDGRVKLQSLLFEAATIAGADALEPREPSAADDVRRIDFQRLPGWDVAPVQKGSGPNDVDDSAGEAKWYPWRVIVIGDVPPARISKVQQQRIVKAVREGGSTLVLLSGPLNMPSAWGTNKDENPLVELFPTAPSSESTEALRQQRLARGFHPVIAPDGRGNPLAQFELDDGKNTDAWERLAGDPSGRTDIAQNWYWHSEYTQARPGASVIWAIEDNDPAAIVARRQGLARAAAPTTSPAGVGPTAEEVARKRALLATMQAGPGKVMFLAGDATWRLRQVRGLNYHEQFWGQVIRWAVGTELPAGGEFVRFGTDKPRYVGGEQAKVTARVREPSGGPKRGMKFKAFARAVGPDGKPDPAGRQVEATFVEDAEIKGQYEATVSNLPAGQVEISLAGDEIPKLLTDDPKAVQKTLTVEAVQSLNLDLQDVNAEPKEADRIAAAAGGAAVRGQYADLLAGQLPELTYTQTSAEQLGLFQDPKHSHFAEISHYVFLGIFVLLVTAEWIIRKRAGLV